MFSRRYFLRHDSTNTLDCFPDFFTYFLMGTDSLLLIVYPIPRQLVPRLSHAKLICRQLSGVHPVHKVFFFRNVLALLYGIIAKSAIKAFVAGIMEYPKHPVLNASFTGSTRQSFELLGCLLADLQPFHIGSKGIRNFLATCLDSKVFLCFGNFGFTWIAVLRNKITGEAGEMIIINNLYCTFTTGYRFAGAGKVMFGLIS